MQRYDFFLGVRQRSRVTLFRTCPWTEYTQYTI